MARFERVMIRGLTVLLLGEFVTLAVLSFAQVVLRKLFDSGLEWADIVARQMVLWVGCTGGALATFEGRHIAIDAVTRWLPMRMLRMVRTIVSISAAAIASVIVYAAARFALDEYRSGKAMTGALPAWPFTAFVPVAFSIIVLAFLVQAIKHLRSAPKEMHIDSSGGLE